MISLLLKSIASSHSLLGKQGIMKGNSQVWKGVVHNSPQFWMQITTSWMLLLDQANANAEKETWVILTHFTSCSSIYAVRAFQHISLIYIFMEVRSTQYMGWVRLSIRDVSPKDFFCFLLSLSVNLNQVWETEWNPQIMSFGFSLYYETTALWHKGDNSAVD